VTVLCTCGAAVSVVPQPSNIARTRAELQRLESDVRLPASSVTHAPVRRLSGAFGTPGAGRSLKEQTQYYRVHLALNRVVTWARAHPPRTLHNTGYGSSGQFGKAPTEVSVDFAGRPTGAYLEPTVEYSAVSGRHGYTFWRVDEYALWLDARPIADHPGKSALRVTREPGCPSSDQDSFDVRNPGAGLSNHLVPAATPDHVLVCRYSGFDAKTPFTLTDSHSASGYPARTLATAARRISLAHLVDVFTNCPMDDGSATVVDFSYANRPDVDLWYAQTGCQSIRNGHTVGGDAPNHTTFYAQLKRLS
jgi:hypothetical protein